MRVWITTGCLWDYIHIHTRKPECAHGPYLAACRKDTMKLLRGNFLRLPKHGSTEVLEIELIARRVGK